MLGKITCEEACQIPKTSHEAKNWSPDGDLLERRLLDIQGGERQKLMDEHGVQFMIMSYTSPGCQGEPNKEKCEALAREANDYLAAICAKDPSRFVLLASCSMHDATQAAQEVERAVKELGCIGVMLNNYQQAGEDGETILMYDGPEYDPFWAKVVELDVVVYIHPRSYTKTHSNQFFQGRPFLRGAFDAFPNGVAMHVISLMANGVFDRHPKVRLMIGHNGERLPFDAWRINHWWEKTYRRMFNLKAKRGFIDYMRSNLYITTSGNFDLVSMTCAISVVGKDRVLFSIDSPYEDVPEGAKWWDSVDISEEDRIKMGRENAIRIFGLDRIKEFKVKLAPGENH